MNEKLIKQLQEADIFTPVSDEDAEIRRKNRPPKVLRWNDVDFTAYITVIVADLILDEVGDISSEARVDAMDKLFAGKPLLPKALNDMYPAELIKYLKYYYNRSGKKAGITFKQWVLDKLVEQVGEYYTAVQGVV